MSEFQTQLKDALPRRSLFKVGSTANATVKKRELIEWHSKQPETHVTTHEKVVDFHISGDCLVDGRNSYFSLELAANSFTAVLSNDITSIIKNIKILLPSNGNLVLERIDNYNALAAMLNIVHRTGKEEATSKWFSGANIGIDNFNEETLPRKRRFLHLNEGGWRTFTFQLHLSSIMNKLEQYLPLFLLNGIHLQITLATPTTAWKFDPAKEQSWKDVFDGIEGLMTGDEYEALPDADKPAVQQRMMDFYGRPAPTGQDLEYRVKTFTYRPVSS